MSVDITSGDEVSNLAEELDSGIDASANITASQSILTSASSNPPATVSTVTFDISAATEAVTTDPPEATEPTEMAKPIALSQPEPFKYDDESRNSAGARWPAWIRAFETFTVASAIADDAQKKAILLHVVGPQACDIYYTLAKTDDKFDDVVKTLTDYFKPLKQLDYHKFVFHGMVREDNESMDDFASRLRAQAKLCEYEGSADIELRARLIYGCRNQRLQERILSEDNMVLAKILELVRNSDAAKQQAKGIAGAIKGDANKMTLAAVQSGAARQSSSTKRAKLASSRRQRCARPPLKQSSLAAEDCGLTIESARRKKKKECCRDKGGAFKSRRSGVKTIRKDLDSSAESYVFTAAVHGNVSCPTAKVEVGHSDTVTMLIDSGASEMCGMCIPHNIGSSWDND